MLLFTSAQGCSELPESTLRKVTGRRVPRVEVVKFGGHAAAMKQNVPIHIILYKSADPEGRVSDVSPLSLCL